MPMIPIVLGESRQIARWMKSLILLTLLALTFVCFLQFKNIFWVLPITSMVLWYGRHQLSLQANRKHTNAIQTISLSPDQQHWQLSSSSESFNKATLFHCSILTNHFLLLHFKVTKTIIIPVLIWQDAVHEKEFRRIKYYINLHESI